ncbi:unnamed protein product [Leptosia nina]|uniref:Uncharacterized protein n=1 Tax=Leptosia nina TaxID=320188 RepID=A0AAV1JJ24_9NEOP
MACPDENSTHLTPKKELSMRSLILWNINKVVEMNSAIDLKEALRSACKHLEKESYDVQALMSQGPAEQHLACAVLAWQRLGHKTVDSLCKFVERNQFGASSSKKESTHFLSTKEGIGSASCSKNVFGTSSLIGPVVRLPVETKIVMHMENPCSRHQPKKTQKKNDVKTKIEACCMDSACIKRLTELDTATGELRKRAARLAKREAERVELLERAETAWKDLEVGYQRRLTLAEEKEEDLTKQIKKLIEDRNAYKNATNVLVQKLKERGATVEREREHLTQLEKEVCNKACERLRLSEQAAQGDAAVAELQCRSTQLDRDLLYREEQARRKVIALDNEVDSIRGLTLEAERAMRSELSALKEQITEVSKQLLGEEATNKAVKTEVEELRQEKMNIIEDLDGCKELCDGRIQKRVDELKDKKDELNELKNRVIDCQCKLPLDAAVEVKRTPSLAALCHCALEDKVLDSCSCVSLRSQLLSNLLSDLFSGLQSELGGTGMQMPCQLLKCLEDRHNWDRASMVKSNLRNFFSQLLIGELDIAIATSIEKYHAKWVGASCADQLRAVSGPCEEDNEGWQERAIERRAQKLATQLAEQLFKERADMITQKAKDVMNAGPPPCECKPQQNAAVYPCLIKTPNAPNPTRRSHDGSQLYLKRTIQDVTNIKSQIEDLKKESIKREDLKQMEDKLARIIQRVAKLKNKKPIVKNETCDTNDITNVANECKIKPNTYKRTKIELPKKCSKVQNNQSGRIEKYSNKLYHKKKEQSLAVNLCLCADQKKAPASHCFGSRLTKSSIRPTLCTDLSNQMSKVKLSKPLLPLQLSRHTNFGRMLENKLCPSNCICLHKIPSNTSLDRLLDVLKNWKCNLDECRNTSNFDVNQEKSILNNFIKDFENKQSINEQLSNIPISSKSAINNDVERINNQNAKDCLPLPKPSEYMGTVILDKSNENFCKCNSGFEINKSIKSGSPENTSRKFAHTNLDDNLKSKESDKDNNMFTTKSQIYSVKLPSNENDCVHTKQQIGIQKDSFMDKLVKDSKLFSYSGEYDIKFLGATLANIHKVKENMEQSVEANKVPKKQENEKSLNQLFDTNIDERENNESNMNTSTKSCVCCKKGDSSDLEYNTFDLLENYLKEKTNEFKKMSCNSSCIQPKDEEKIYSTILKKVKELIVVNTEPLSCKCCKGNKEDGNWSRVYGLLREYLQMKIQRIKCSCLKTEDMKNDDLILPNVLEEVTNLINNDFQRLKKLCVCDTKQTAKKNSLHKFNESEGDFLDNDSGKSTKPSITVKCSKAISPLVLPPLDIVDESCSAFPLSIDNSPINVAMVEKVTSCKLNTFYVTDCECRYTFTEPVSEECANKYPGTIYRSSSSDTKTSTTSKGVSNEGKYIGYTLNCTCERYLGCVCTKSLVETNDEKINFIWNSITNNIQPQKLSYIMRAIPPNSKSVQSIFPDNYYNFHVTNSPAPDNKEEVSFDVTEIEKKTVSNFDNICYTQTSLKDAEGIILKESQQALSKTSNKTSMDDILCCEETCSSSHQSFVTIPNDHDHDIITSKNTLYNSLYLPAVEDGTASYKSDVFDNSETSRIREFWLTRRGPSLGDPPLAGWGPQIAIAVESLGDPPPGWLGSQIAIAVDSLGDPPSEM